MIGNKNEVALSEVIGFVLILGLITVAFSLYLVYGVPAQGRENEILHMGVVKDQFVEYKVGLDSLFTNNLVGTTMSNTFSLGTGGGYTQGSNSIIPILSPASSGGIFMINRGTTGSDTLTITSNSYITGPGRSTSVDLNPSATVNYMPNHVYINISNIQNTDLNSMVFFGAKVDGTNWVATVNLTPQLTFYQYYASVTPPGGSSIPGCTGGTPDLNQNGTAINVYITSSTYACLVPMNQSKYSGTDLTISITKGSVVTMENYPVYTNVAPNAVYTIDLMDDSYGLKPLIKPADTGKPQETITLKKDLPLNGISATGNITYDFAENISTIGPITLGAVEYRSDNYYWIPQTYYYQMGGVFLKQSDGNTTYKLPPEISVSYNFMDPPHISTVNINALAIFDPTYGGGSLVGGNSPVQIKTTLMSNNALPYAVGTANTRWINISVNTSDDQAREMWKNYFKSTASAAYLPTNTYTVGNTTTESYIDIYGSNPSLTGETFDINVIASSATYSATVYGVGG